MLSFILVKRKCWLTLSLLFGLMVNNVTAQQTDGSIKGLVTDSAGKVLNGASVTAVHTPSGTQYATQTDSRGSFLLPNLRIGGPYTLSATYTGMKKFEQDNVEVRLGDPLKIDIRFYPADKVLENVVITATARRSPLAGKYGSGQNISGTQIANMPAISRSLQDITRLVPQSSKDNSFAGTNFRYNNITIDGAINNDAIGFSPSAGGITGTSGTPGSSTRTNAISLDAIQDMQVYLAPYDVKIGNFTGGSINAVTRSGTNKVGGSVYGFGRNAALTGSDKAGSLGKMNDKYYDFQGGFRLGFPIVKNKLFFFTNAEITRRRDPTQLNVGSKETEHILSASDAENIRQFISGRYGDSFDPGSAGLYLSSSQSQKIFNRLDWNINSNNQLTIRNSTVWSKAVNMDRDQMDFRFSSMAYRQTNNQSSTVAELKSKLGSGLSNVFLVGYTTIRDYRTPLSNPALPQVQILGRSPGTTIYLGTDREASIFNMRQKTLEITNNLTWHRGNHTILFGTHNELYSLNYGFVNAWNGRVDYLSIEDFLASNPYRVRGSFNYNNNNRDYILANPEAKFNVNMIGVYVQDEVRVNNRLGLTPGIRLDYTFIPEKPAISERTQNAIPDAHFGSTYYYQPLSQITNKFLTKPQFSPRIGLRYDLSEDKAWVLRGGAGYFTGRIPFAWLGYAFYNTGINYGAYDQKSDEKPFVPGSDPLRPSSNGIADFIKANGVIVNKPMVGQTQVDVISDDFVMPKVMRASLGIDFHSKAGYKFTVEGLYTKTIKDVFFQQINIKDDPRYYGFDINHRYPVFSGSVDPSFSNVYQLSNTNQGSRFSVTGTVSKNYHWGLNVNVSYTYGESKDVFNGIRNSMESNWQLNQALHPNNAGLAWSNFDIRHRIVSTINYRKTWSPFTSSTLSFFVSAQSGSPFTYGIVNYSPQGLSQQVSLAYIPGQDEAVHFFKDIVVNGTTITAATQAAAFNAYIDGNKYLKSRRGDFTERNTGRTLWNNTIDLYFAQEFHLNKNKKDQVLTLSLTVVNFANLLNKSWGLVYFSPNTFNSTASIGLVPVQHPSSQNPGNYPVFTFSDPGKPYAIDYFNSRTQGQLGLRYSF